MLVAALVPATAAPTTIPIADISSSDCTTMVEPGLLFSTSKVSFDSRNSLSSDAGVIG